MHRLFRTDVAEDIASTVFLSLAQRFDELSDRDEPDMVRWLYGTANNHITSYFRSEKRRKAVIEAAYRKHLSNASQHKSSSNGKVDWPTLYQALMRLKVEHQTIITLRFLDGLPADEVASILDMKPGAVRTAAHRALKKLRTILESHQAQQRGSS